MLLSETGVPIRPPPTDTEWKRSLIALGTDTPGPVRPLAGGAQAPVGPGTDVAAGHVADTRCGPGPRTASPVCRARQVHGGLAMTPPVQCRLWSTG